MRAANVEYQAEIAKLRGTEMSSEPYDELLLRRSRAPLGQAIHQERFPAPLRSSNSHHRQGAINRGERCE